MGSRSIFCFGSNRAGKHGAGAALRALRSWGAVYGVGEGLTGRAYALPTKDHALHTLSLADIARHVRAFHECAAYYHRNWFLLTEIGCGLAGYRARDMVPLFVSAGTDKLRNVYWPAPWARMLSTPYISFDDAGHLLKYEQEERR